MKTLITSLTLIMSFKLLSAQTFCFYNPNTGPLYNNGSFANYDITCGDFNNDNHLDIATANSTGNNISFLAGDGNGALGSPIIQALPNFLSAITSGDFNSDGFLDIATSGGGPVYVLFGNGNGTFQPFVSYAGGNNLSRIYTKDINSDSILDLMEACGNGVWVFIGNNNGTFSQGVQYITGGSVTDVAIADFDNDAIPDIVSTTRIAVTVSVLSFLKGNSNGIFNPAISISVPHYSIFGINATDVDTNGTQDLIVSNLNNMIHRMEIYLGNGNGTFNSPIFYPTFYNPSYVYLTDMNGDMAKDIVVPEVSGFSILTGNSNGTFNAFQKFVAASAPNALCIGDFDEDGKLDLVNPDGSAGYISMTLNCTTTGTFEIENNMQQSVEIFPNPFSEFTNIHFSSAPKNATIEIENVMGQKIMTINNISQTDIKLNCSYIRSGFYFINVLQNEKIISKQKLIIAD